MALPDVVDKYGNVQVADELFQLCVVAVVVFCEVHSQYLRLDLRARMFLLNLLGESLKFRFGARDEDKVESFLGELEGEFFAKAVGRSGNNSPGTWLAVFAELSKYEKSFWTRCFVTYRCAFQDK
jgi:hypothetical protein